MAAIHINNRSRTRTCNFQLWQSHKFWIEITLELEWNGRMQTPLFSDWLQRLWLLVSSFLFSNHLKSFDRCGVGGSGKPADGIDAYVFGKFNQTNFTIEVAAWRTTNAMMRPWTREFALTFPRNMWTHTAGVAMPVNQPVRRHPLGVGRLFASVTSKI